MGLIDLLRKALREVNGLRDENNKGLFVEPILSRQIDKLSKDELGEILLCVDDATNGLTEFMQMEVPQVLSLVDDMAPPVREVTPATGGEMKEARDEEADLFAGAVALA